VGGYERAQRRASEGRISRRAVGGTWRLAYSGAAQAQGIYFSPPGLDLNREPKQKTENRETRDEGRRRARGKRKACT
jgi:hypothetical protein